MDSLSEALRKLISEECICEIKLIWRFYLLFIFTGREYFEAVQAVSLYFVTGETSPPQWETLFVLTLFKQKAELPFVLWE